MQRSLPRRLRYQHGAYGGFFHSEALAGALPRRQNTPQKPAYGLFPELLSGTAFTQPRHQNHYSWMYRVRPSVLHSPSAGSSYKLWDHPTWTSPPFGHHFPPVQFRFRPAPAPVSDGDFVDGMVTIGAFGDPAAQDGAAASVFAAAASMAARGRVLRNHDADTMLLPQEGRLAVRTEFGTLEVGACEMALVPRGMTFQVNLAEGVGAARGYCLENFGSQFVIPDLGPIGISSGLAHPRHFLAPEAQYEDAKGDFELVSKFLGRLYRSPIAHSPFDVVAWYGNYVPCKYDLRLFMAINTVTYDHPDPSIGCVMSSYTSTPGRANIDFVIFPPRYMVAENTFRPPWYHRNDMSEFMGLLHGSYDAKPGSFVPGASSIHNRFVPHGPDGEALEKGTELDTSRTQRMENTMAFMWESSRAWHPTAYALSDLDDAAYPQCWEGVRSRFDAGDAPSGPEGYAFDPKIEPK